MELLVPYQYVKECVGHHIERIELELGEEEGFIHPTIPLPSGIRRTFLRLADNVNVIPCDEIAIVSEELEFINGDDVIALETVGDIVEEVLTKNELESAHLSMTKRGLIISSNPSKGAVQVTK